MGPEGFRGTYGTAWVTEDNYFRLPFVLKELMGVEHFVVAHDPRPTSEPLYYALLEGASKAGLNISAAGMLPTPILAKWAHDHQCLGLMVTASHNPVSDNGIKFIGFRLDEEMRHKAVLLMQQSLSMTESLPFRSLHNTIKHYYVDKLKEVCQLGSYRCLVDTAYGAWHQHLDVLQELGFKVSVYNGKFDAQLMNTTGSVVIDQQDYPQGYDYVVAFDGDGDRLQMVKDGHILDGDDLLYHLAQNESGVVGTIMTNTALEAALVDKAILYRTNVGDQLVRQEIINRKVRYGAEPCGHILDLQWMGYSDPVYILAHALSKGEIQPLKKAYQYHMNLPMTADIDQICQQFSHPFIRLVVRRSNTEPLVRVMLEGEKGLIKALMKSYSLNSADI